MSKYDKWYIIGKLLCSTFRICKKNLQICKKWIFYRKIQLYSKNVCKKKICPKNDKLYIFEKPMTMPFQICKYFSKILNNLNFNQENLKMCKFPLRGCLQKNCIFSQFVSLCQRLSKKLNFIKIWQVDVGQSQVGLLQE